jgi:hypothetical protein
MTTSVKLNACISLPDNFPQEPLEVGKQYSITKDGYRVIPLGTALEISDDNNHYLGKGKVIKLTITSEGTEIVFEVLKLFSPEESKVFDANDIR